MMLTEHIIPSTNQLEIEYESALKTYLARGGEDALQQAYEFGRSAVFAGLGILDVAEIHHRAISAILLNRPPEEMAQGVKNAMIFFEESVSPFEITHRGYREAVDTIQRVINFAFMATHEIKAPLTSILSSAGMLQEIFDADPASPQGRLLANLLTGVSILKSHVDDMIDITALYAGAMSIRRQSVMTRNFLRQVFEHLEPEVNRRGMKLRFRVARNIPSIEMDPDRIEQVITNLVQNAVKYAADGGLIELSAAAQPDYVVIAVRDWGKGLPAYEEKMLLTLDDSIRRDSRAQGTGLGLILCRQIVEAHRGEIKLANQPGTGNAFEIWLPISNEPQIEETDESINR